MITLLGQGSADAGLSVICAPNDTLVNTALEASAEQLSILNWNHRLGGSSAPLRFTRYIVAHDACWRPGLAWLAAEFPSYFESHPDSGSENLWGSGQYMDYRGNEEGDIESFWRRLNLTTNWDATFPWPWWGNYMPTEPEWLDCLPVGHNAPGTGVVQPWNRKYGKNTHLTKDWQCERMNHSAVRGWYDKLQRRLGAGTLYYGNAFEFGSWTVDPAEPLINCDPMPAAGSGNHSAYCEANVALRKMADAILRTKGGGLLEETRGHASPCNPPPDGCGARIAPGMTIGDPGVESFQEFLLGVLRNQMEYTPGAGLAMDRQDHCVGFRIGGDDGVSYDAEHGGVTSHLGQGFKKIMRRFAKELHAQKQALFLSSTGNRRLDFSETMDGYFDEIGDSPGSFAVNGLLAINQPLVTWCHNCEAEMRSQLRARVSLTRKRACDRSRQLHEYRALDRPLQRLVLRPRLLRPLPCDAPPGRIEFHGSLPLGRSHQPHEPADGRRVPGVRSVVRAAARQALGAGAAGCQDECLIGLVQYLHERSGRGGDSAVVSAAAEWLDAARVS